MYATKTILSTNKWDKGLPAEQLATRRTVLSPTLAATPAAVL
ncbi:MAG: hypothetical protein ABR577_00115 [Pyrinomonadaceae bacterium]